MYNEGSFAEGYAVGRDTNNSNCNDGMFGGSGWWVIILLVFLFGGFGGYGLGGFGGFGGGIGGVRGGCYSPCATQADVRAAVDQQTLISKLDQQTYGLADSTYALNNALNNGFYGVNTAILQSSHATDRAVCDLGYNIQSGFNTLGHAISDCCCTTQRAIDQVNYNMATNTCALQNTIQNTTRDIVENQNANSRAILDALTAQRIADKDERIAMQNQKIFALELAASQANQNAVLQAAMDANTATILRRTGAECPTAAYIVQPPTPVNFPTNCCGQVQFSNGCNNGCNGFN